MTKKNIEERAKLDSILCEENNNSLFYSKDNDEAKITFDEYDLELKDAKDINKAIKIELLDFEPAE